MKSAKTILRMFKGMVVMTRQHEVMEGMDCHYYSLSNVKDDAWTITAIYEFTVPLEPAKDARERREREQIQELVKALDALPRYEERR